MKQKCGSNDGQSMQLSPAHGGRQTAGNILAISDGGILPKAATMPGDV